MIVWSDRALADLINLSESIENNFTNELADKITDELISYIESQLKISKEIGRPYEPNPYFRYLVFKGNKVFYTPYEDNKNIYVIHINIRGSKPQTFPDKNEE
ncbi:plasmid stabilization system protein, RelE/ParE family [Bacteriovorax sp. BAL6_X]|uniref:type II toxin-antitoxin system RelE/ParE family toxin n=1 Tax=Bacteriovorax sp. BAL6_X TaxID=1201290 RepID=UPI000386E3DB|nr:type II toxin-antitoxin system RelE/ParE family toxin [Bacteriovorax sp. BAL6_X]EPZ51017.1 plasmid stabilization system protein, RelE/ParE family [Bacteriovorax sp. BAL6_X]